MSDVNRSLEFYNGAAIEKVTPKPLVLPDNPRFSLVTGIYVGRHGQVGMGILDRCPKQRSATYPAVDFTESSHPKGDAMSDSRLSELVHYFLDKDQEFEIIRCVVLPKAVSAFFTQDIYMGARLIDNCIMGTVPGGFNEAKAEQTWPFDTTGEIPAENRLPYSAVRVANPALLRNGPSEDLDSGVSCHAYVSSHPFKDQDEIMKLVERSIPVSLGHLDRAIELLGGGVKLPSRYVSFSSSTSQQQLPPPGI